jgi:hypothetical protein
MQNMNKMPAVSGVYREVCHQCGRRTEIVTVHFLTDRGALVVRSTRLCAECSLVLVYRLASIWSGRGYAPRLQA